MIYSVIRNRCKCHPETCGCNPWKVVNSNGDLITTNYTKEAAQQLVNLLNTNLGEKA